MTVAWFMDLGLVALAVSAIVGFLLNSEKTAMWREFLSVRQEPVFEFESSSVEDDPESFPYGKTSVPGHVIWARQSEIDEEQRYIPVPLLFRCLSPFLFGWVCKALLCRTCLVFHVSWILLAGCLLPARLVLGDSWMQHLLMFPIYMGAVAAMHDMINPEQAYARAGSGIRLPFP